MEPPSVNGSCKFRSWFPGTGAILLEEVLGGILMGTSMVLNLVLLVTVSCSPHLHTSTHIFISSLSVSDIFTSAYGLIRLTIMATEICFPIETRILMDKALNTFYLVNTFSSYMNILIVSVERWLYISRPFLHQRLISHRFAIVGVGVAWATSLIVNLDSFVFTLNNYWAISNFKYLALLPCFHSALIVVLCLIYFQVTMITRRQIKAINKTSYLRRTIIEDTRSIQLMDTTMKQLRGNIKSIRLLVTVFGGFLLLLSPGVYYHFYSAYLMLSQGEQEDPQIHEGLKLLTYSHMLENFIVFVSLDKYFRHVLTSWLRIATCRQVRCVGQAQNIISLCRRCWGGHTVGVDEGNSGVGLPGRQ